MQQIKFFFLFIAVAVSFGSYAQETGFYGKKTFVEFGVQGQLPVFQNLFAEKGYVEKDGTFRKSYNLIDYGFKGALGTMLSENFGVALEYNHRFYQINALRGEELNRQYTDSQGVFHTDYITPQVAFLPIREMMFMPKFIFTSGMGRIPAGLTHEIGIGYSLISVADDNFQVAYSGTNGISAESIAASLIDPRFNEVRGITYMYGIRMNYPVSKSLLLSVGFRYSYAGLLNKKGFREKEQTEAWLSGREMWSRINERRQLGIINFSVGGTFCF